MKQKLLIPGAVVFAGLAATFAIAYSAGPSDPFAPCRETTMIDYAKIGGPFELIDESGQSVSDTDILTRPTLLYMGYTFCPDVCPLDNMRNADAALMLEEQGLDLQTVFVSVDPKRDTPEVLAEFTDVFHPEMIGLTGTRENLDQMAEDYISTFEFRDEDDDEYYLIDHTTMTFLILPERGVVDLVQRDESAKVVADRAACILQNA